MSQTLLIWVVTGLYVVQAGWNAYSGQHASATILAGYVVANLGLIWSIK